MDDDSYNNNDGGNSNVGGLEGRGKKRRMEKRISITRHVFSRAAAVGRSDAKIDYLENIWPDSDDLFRQSNFSFDVVFGGRKNRPHWHWQDVHTFDFFFQTFLLFILSPLPPQALPRYCIIMMKASTTVPITYKNISDNNFCCCRDRHRKKRVKQAERETERD